MAILAVAGCVTRPAGSSGAAAGDGAVTTASEETTTGFRLTSPAVVGGELLAEYRGEQKDANGVEDSIPLEWAGVPAGTKSLAVIMHHYPRPGNTAEVNSYLLLWGIDPNVTGISHGAADDGPWYMGANKDGTVVSYTSPNSPNPATHEYTITLYALSETPPSLPDSSTTEVTYEVLKRAIGTVDVIDTATLTFVTHGTAPGP